MCTVTWLRNKAGYSLFFNRDERITRRPALGPKLSELRGVKYVAPVDGDHGGSWIGVNEFGVSFCLLNRYGDIPIAEQKTYVSRGLLLLDLLDCCDLGSLQVRMPQFDLSRFRPFTLLGVAIKPPSILFQWTGFDFSVATDAESFVPFTSTSVREPGIALLREQQFQLLKSGGLSDSTLELFHRSHVPERGAYSVCMHREGASTVSLSKVVVSNHEIEFGYEAGSPCKSSETQRVIFKTSLA
jgi:hypothetical protein